MSSEKAIIVDHWVIARGDNYVAHRTANSRDYEKYNNLTFGSSSADEKVRLELAGKSAVKFYDHIANGGDVEITKNQVKWK